MSFSLIFGSIVGLHILLEELARSARRKLMYLILILLCCVLTSWPTLLGLNIPPNPVTHRSAYVSITDDYLSLSSTLRNRSKLSRMLILPVISFYQLLHSETNYYGTPLWSVYGMRVILLQRQYGRLAGGI